MIDFFSETCHSSCIYNILYFFYLYFLIFTFFFIFNGWNLNLFFVILNFNYSYEDDSKKIKKNYSNGFHQLSIKAFFSKYCQTILIKCISYSEIIFLLLHAKYSPFIGCHVLSESRKVIDYCNFQREKEIKLIAISELRWEEKGLSREFRGVFSSFDRCWSIEQMCQFLIGFKTT